MKPSFVRATRTFRDVILFCAFPVFAPLRRGQQFFLWLAVALRCRTVALCVGWCLGGSISALAQGSLTPPGAPAATMKTLSQIESRTVIDPSKPGFTTPYNITQPGSYYLAGNINISNGTDGIRIQADDVTLDLNGFSIISTSSPAAGKGIVFYGAETFNALIRNGIIHGAGFLAGVDNTNTGPPGGSVNTRVADLAVSNCTQGGITLFDPSPQPGLVERCTVTSVGGTGIRAANVSHCNVFSGTGTGIDAKICSDCYAEGNAVGISAITVSNSYGSSSGTGIQAQTVTNSTGFTSSGTGIGAAPGNLHCNATGSYGSGSSGILVETVTNCVGVGTTGPGVRAQIATNSEGQSTSGIGVQTDLLATNCRGVSTSGDGLDSSVTANSCFGSTGIASAIGLKVTGTANVCGGQNTAGGVAIQASIGIGCGLYGGTSSIPAGGKFLGTL